jgi:hypothetical protein
MTMSDESPRDALARRIRDVLSAHADVREVSMFGCRAFMVDDRLAVGARGGGALLVRTDPADVDELRRRGGEQAFMGSGRPMGAGWLVVPPSRLDDDAELAFWVEVGLGSIPV